MMKQTISSGWSPNIFSADLFWSSVIVVVVQLACSWNVFVHVSRKKGLERGSLLLDWIWIGVCVCQPPSITWKSYTIIIHGSRSWRNGRIRMSRAEFCFPTCFSYLFLLRRPFNPLGSAVVINIFKEEVEGGLEGICVSTFRPVTLGSFVVKKRILFSFL